MQKSLQNLESVCSMLSIHFEIIDNGIYDSHGQFLCWLTKRDINLLVEYLKK